MNHYLQMTVGRANRRKGGKGESQWREGLPFLLLIASVMALRSVMVPWVFMWALAGAIFLGCKWVALRVDGVDGVDGVDRMDWMDWMDRMVWYFGWPGLDAAAFFARGRKVTPPGRSEWLWAVAKIGLGAVMLWVVTPWVPSSQLLVKEWCGLIGLGFLLHFGGFHFLALVWRQRGVDAQPLMRTPIAATSLGDFWGRRWNTAFSHLAEQTLFQPFRRTLGVPGATLLVFAVSGLVHELAISLPARAGYGGPTGYFLWQGAGVLLERSGIGRALHLRHGLRGRIFTLVWVTLPVGWLFHAPFLDRVILPFLRTLRAW